MIGNTRNYERKKRRAATQRAFLFARLPSALETDLRSELSQTRAAGSVRDPSEICRVLQIACRIGKVHSIEQIENVETDIYAYSLVDLRRFGKTYVETLLRRSAKDISSRVAETAERRRETAAVDHRLISAPA